METRQRPETWPVVDAEFEPVSASPKQSAPVSASSKQSAPVSVVVKRRIPKPVQVASFIGGIFHG